MAEERILSYGDAIKEALDISLKSHPEVIIFGEGVNDLNGMFGTTVGLADKYGYERVLDVPLSETGMAGIGVGAALGGLHPIFCHNRPDFLFLSMDQIVNHAAKYRYMSGGQCKVPYIIWACTGQGWGSAAQHSQELHGMFMQIPGLKIISPTTPYDAKGMLLSAVEDNNTILFLDHRRLYSQSGNVPEGEYRIPVGKARIARLGTDITIVAVSSMVPEAEKACNELEKQGISVELVDIRTVMPLDYETILESVRKTKRVVVVDNASPRGGLASELSAFISERAFGELDKPVYRLTYPDVPVPAAYTLEEKYFISSKDIVLSVRKLFG